MVIITAIELFRILFYPAVIVGAIAVENDPNYDDLLVEITEMVNEEDYVANEVQEEDIEVDA